MKYVIVFLVSTAAAILMSSFVIWEINPSEWNMDQRFGTLIAWMVLMFIGVGVTTRCGEEL